MVFAAFKDKTQTSGLFVNKHIIICMEIQLKQMMGNFYHSVVKSKIDLKARCTSCFHLHLFY